MPDLASISMFDIAVVVVVVISALLAWLRGFVREVFSLLSWIGAIMITLYAFGPLQPYARQLIPQQVFADVGLGIALFLVSILILSIISGRICSVVSASSHGGLDRALGFLFGMLRGVLISAVAFLLILKIAGDGEPPRWLQGSRTAPILAIAAKQIDMLLPGWVKQKAEDAGKQAERTIQNGQDVDRLFRQYNAPLPVAAQPRGEQPAGGYKPEERRGLDRLLQGTN